MRVLCLRARLGGGGAEDRRRHRAQRAREAKATLIGQRLTPETAPVAGRAAFDGAPPGRHNGFKIDLGARAVAVALMTASAPPPLVTAIAFRAQPVALVVAEMLEAAIEGGEAIRPTHENEDFASMIDSEEAAREPVEDRAAGDAATAMGRAATTIEGTYGSPTQHITRSS